VKDSEQFLFLSFPYMTYLIDQNFWTCYPFMNHYLIDVT